MGAAGQAAHGPRSTTPGGHVLFHSPDKLAVYDRVKVLRTPFDISVWYTGPVGPGDADEYLLNVGLFL